MRPTRYWVPRGVSTNPQTRSYSDWQSTIHLGFSNGISIPPQSHSPLPWQFIRSTTLSDCRRSIAPYSPHSKTVLLTGQNSLPPLYNSCAGAIRIHYLHFIIHVPGPSVPVVSCDWPQVLSLSTTIPIKLCRSRTNVWWSIFSIKARNTY